MALHHDVIIARLAASQAARRAALGPVAHPAQVFHDALGHRIYPGQKVLDRVTGQLVEVQYAGIVQASSHQALPS
jgi:hypothetical protein